MPLVSEEREPLWAGLSAASSAPALAAPAPCSSAGARRAACSLTCALRCGAWAVLASLAALAFLAVLRAPGALQPGLGPPRMWTSGAPPGIDFTGLSLEGQKAPLAAAATKLPQGGKKSYTCLGKLKVRGYHDVELIPEGWKMDGPDADDAATVPGHVQISSDATRVKIHHKSRVYFGEKCTPGEYNPGDYTNLKLLGKRFRFTANIQGVQCGCNAAMYFTPMHQNTGFKNRVGSYYCDANYVGAFTWGKKEEGCQEIDIMEANQYSIHSTLHAWGVKQEGTPANGYIQVWKSTYGHDGLAGGNGGGMGGGNGPRSFTNTEFCPGSSTIDTSKEFELVTSFYDKGGSFDRFVVEMFQGGRIVRGGLTPILSFWSSKTMSWMDGPGADGLGPCKEETMGCEDMDIEFGNFAIEDL